MGASVALSLACLVSGTASAATITVTEATDDYFAPPGGFCSLREAVQAANNDADFGGCARVGSGSADTILLMGGQTYTRTRNGYDDTNVDGDLDLSGKTTIAVEGAGRATIDAQDMDRVVEVHPGARLTASRLTITDGYVIGLDPGTGGGGIRSMGRLVLRSSTLFDNEAQRGGSGCGCGGGIESGARMDLKHVRLVHNLATYVGGGIYANAPDQTIARSSIEGNTAFDGGGIFARDEMRVASSTIAANDARGGPLDDNGGGLYVQSFDGPVTVVNSTVSGNRAEEYGGGIFRAAGKLKLNAVTVTGNTADYTAAGTGHGGGVDGGGSGDGIKLTDTILAGNVDLNTNDPGPDCSRITGGLNAHNLLGEDGGCPAGPRDLTSDRWRLKPLAENGGPTRTHALKAGSPAVGKAGSSAPNRDQRGHKRDQHPDIGSYER